MDKTEKKEINGENEANRMRAFFGEPLKIMAKKIKIAPGRLRKMALEGTIIAKKVPKSGPPGYEWYINPASLPMKYQARYYRQQSHATSTPPAGGGLVPPSPANYSEMDSGGMKSATSIPLSPNSSLKAFNEASPQKREVALARAEIISRISKLDTPKQQTQNLRRWLEDYNSKRYHFYIETAGGRRKDIFEVVGKISPRTYRHWRRAYMLYGISGLLNGYGGMKGATSIPPEIKNEISALIFERRRSSVKIYDYLKQKFDKLPSYRTIHRWIKKFKEENQSALLLAHEGERAWRDKYKICLYAADSECAQPNDRWEIDTTPADIITAEGRRSKIIAVIDVFSRRVKARLWENSNAWAIAQTLRAGFLDFGIPRSLVMDLGLDYQSNLVKQICKELNIKRPYVPGYTPEAKPHIERFFRTLSEDLFSEMAGYTGNCLKNRPQIIIKHYNAQDVQEKVNQYIENVYEERIHRGINKRPREAFQVAGFKAKKVDERLLDVLLMPVKKRKVTGSCIRNSALKYYAPQLFDLNGQEVDVAIDHYDAGTLYIYKDNTFVCLAHDPLAKNIPYEEIKRTRREKKRAQKDILKAYRALGKKDPVDERLSDLLESKNGEKPLVFPQKAEVISFPKFQEALDEIAAQTTPMDPEEIRQREIDEEEKEFRENDKRDWYQWFLDHPDRLVHSTKDDLIIFFSERDRYKWLRAKRFYELPIDSEDEGYMEEFEKTGYYLEDYYRGMEGVFSTLLRDKEVAK